MKETVKHYIFIIGISLIATFILGFIYHNDTLRGHDLSFHIANIQNMVDHHLNINFIMPVIGNNLGYGLYIFYPFLPHFIYALLTFFLSIFKISTIDSILIINVFISIISSIVLYFLSYKLSKNKKVAFLSAIIYLLFPYRLGIITVRMALNENFAGIFMPIILLGLSYLLDENINKKKFYIYFVLGYVGLILSHYVLALFFTIIIWIILLWNMKKIIDKNRFIPLIKAIILISILVLPNIIIFFEHYQMPYLVYLEGYVTSKELIDENILSLKDYLIPNNNYDWDIPYYISTPVIFSFIYSSYYVIKHKDKKYIFIVLMALLLGFVISSHTLWNLLPKVFDMIQFPWRLLLILSLFVSLISPIFLQEIKNRKIYIGIIFIFLIPSFFLASKLSSRIYTYDYTNIDMNDGVGNIKEYYPVEYLDCKEYYENKKDVDFISSSGNSKIIENDISKNIFTFEIDSDKKVTIELPRIYYKGYVLEDETHHKIRIKRSNYGFIETKVSSGIYTLKYIGTPIYIIFKYIRIGLILYLCFNGFKFIYHAWNKDKI